MYRIFTDYNLDIENRLQFLNYLIFQDYGLDKFKIKDWDLLYKEGLILFPKTKLNSKLKIWDKFHLRRLYKSYKKDQNFLSLFLEDFFYVIKVEEATLVELDKVLSPIFKTNKKAQDRILVLTDRVDLQQFNEVVVGIDSPIIKFFSNSDIETFNREISNVLSKLGLSPKLLFHYKLGCTALDK